MTTVPTADGTISFECDSVDGYREREMLNKIKWVRRKKKTTCNCPQSKTTFAGTGPQTQNDLGDDEEFEDDIDEPEVEYEPDRWTVSGESLIRIHNIPRTKLFSPRWRQ